MADSGNKLGDAYVELRLRMDKLEQDAAQAKPIIEGIAKKQEEIANNTRQSADAAGGWASKLNGVWQTWNSITGTMKTAMEIGQKIGETFVVNTEQVNEFIQAISRIPIAMQAAALSAKIMQKQNQLREIEDYKADQWARPITSSVNKILYEAKYGTMNEDQVREELNVLTRDQRGLSAQSIGANSRNYYSTIQNNNATSDVQAASVTGGLGELNANIKRQNEQTFMNGNPRP